MFSATVDRQNFHVTISHPKTKLESVLVGAMLVLSWHWVRRCNSAMAAQTEPKATQSNTKNNTNVLTMVGAHSLGVLEVVGKLDAINPVIYNSVR